MRRSMYLGGGALSSPLPPSPPLLADFVNCLLIGNQPPWHLSLDILTSRTRFWLHSRMGATLARATVKPESVVKIALQQPKIKIEDGKISLSINLCLNTSLRRTPVCSCKSGTRIILPPLGQLFCGLPLGGRLEQAADLRFR